MKAHSAPSAPSALIEARPASGPGADVADLAAAARRGDREALQALYGRYRPLLAGVVARVRPPLPAGVEPGDLEQEAAQQFCELVRAFDPDRGVNLTTYLQKALKWRVASFLRAEARRAGHLPLESADLSRLADEMAVSPSPERASPRLARALRQLSPRQRAVIAGLYWRERTAGEMARELGVTPQAVTALRRRAEAAIREELSEDQGSRSG